MACPSRWVAKLWRKVCGVTRLVISAYALTFVDFPPMQRGASFNLDALKAEMAAKMAQAEAAAKGPSN